MESFTTDGLVSLLTLTFLETVLGIVNIVFIDRNRKKIVYP
jgi:predicted tellurium resistance membrane protein TerC